MVTTSSVHNPTGRVVAEHPGVQRLARVGWLAKGIVYLLAGLLAAGLVAASRGWSNQAGGTEASPTGALREVASHSWGPALLWLLAAGLFLYALWRVISAFLPGDGDAKSWLHRIGWLVSAALYATLGLTALSLARHHPAKNGNQQATNLTFTLMTHTGGRWLIGVVGVLLIAVGIYRAVKGVRLDVDDELDLSGMSRERRRTISWLGAVGEVGRGIALGLIGFFLVRAAWQFKPDEATGLDGALRRLLVSGWGTVVVAIVAIGFLAYGLFCTITFHRRRLQAP